MYRILSQAGFHIVAVDYRGYADSTGYPCEESVVDDSVAAYNWIKHQNPKARIIVWGHSLGSAIATKLVARLVNDPPLCLILETPFNNLYEAAYNYPLSALIKPHPLCDWGFMGGFARQQLYFKTDENLLHVKVPILIVHGEDDIIVPYKLGRKLYDTVMAANSELDIEFVTIDGKFNYGHKHLWKAPELPGIIVSFYERVAHNA